MNEKSVFKSALLLVERESNAVVDRKALRAFGIREFQIMSSGLEAAQMLASKRVGNPEMVLCNEHLADMDADDFVRLVRLHPDLVPHPVIVTVSKDSMEVRAKARECRYSGLVVRPYTHEALGSQLELAHQCREATREALKGRTDTDIKPFETEFARLASAASNQQDQVSDQLLREGMMSVRQKRWDEAMSLLQEVLRRDEKNVEALIGLAASWNGKGNTRRAMARLGEAIAVLADARQWEKALAVSQRIMRDNPNTTNPLLVEVGRLLTSGQFEELTPALEVALVMPVTIAAVDELARACTVSVDPEMASEQLVMRLKRVGQRSLVVSFKDRMRVQAAAAAAAATQAAAAEAVETATSEGVSGLGTGSESLAAQDDDSTSQVRGPGLDASGQAWGEPAKAGKGIAAPERAGPPVQVGKKKKNTELVEPSSGLFASIFPRLNEALLVAKVTLGLFKNLK